MADMKQCCIMFFPAILITFAFILSAGNTIYCESIKFKPKTDTVAVDNSTSLPVLHFGFFNYRRVKNPNNNNINNKDNPFSLINDDGWSGTIMPSECRGYNDNEIDYDTEWLLVRIFAGFSIVIGALLVAAAIFAPCFARCLIGGGYKTLALCVFMVIPILQGFTFLILKSNLCTNNNNPILESNTKNGISLSELYSSSCELDTGSYANITSIVLWILGGAAMLVIGPPQPKEPRNEIQTVTYEQTYEPESGITTVNEKSRQTNNNNNNSNNKKPKF